MRAELNSRFSLTECAAQMGGLVVNPDYEFQSISTDSRDIQQGDVYIALAGEHYDGHDYCEEALNQGAKSLIVNRYMHKLDCVQWVVKNTTHALGALAQHYRNQFSMPLIAITGSSGKTTVKDMIAAILKMQVGDEYSDKIVITELNNNNEIGVAFTLFRLNEQTKLAVIEMGARHIGDIKQLSEWAQPTITLVTNVGNAHVGVFGSAQNIIDTKGEIYDQTGHLATAILNVDSLGFKQYYSQTKHLSPTLVTMSAPTVNGSATFHATDITETETETRFQLHTPIDSYAISLATIGKHNVSNALMAIACCWNAGVQLNYIIEGLRQFQATTGRMSIRYHTKKFKLIDDTYNANPESTKASIDTLLLHSGKKFLVLGDMKELGATSMAQHNAVLAHALAIPNTAMTILLTGEVWKNIQTTADNVHWYQSKDELIVSLGSMLASKSTMSSTVLVKGSRLMAMESVVEALVSALRSGSFPANGKHKINYQGGAV